MEIYKILVYGQLFPFSYKEKLTFLAGFIIFYYSLKYYFEAKKIANKKFLVFGFRRRQ